MKISNGKETHDLQIIDTDTRVEWTKDFLNACEWRYDEETEVYTKENADMEFILSQALDAMYGRGDFECEANIWVVWDGEDKIDAVYELESNPWVIGSVREPINPSQVWTEGGFAFYKDETGCTWQTRGGLVRWKEDGRDWCEWHYM